MSAPLTETDLEPIVSGVTDAIMGYVKPRLSALESAIVSLTERIAALEARPEPRAAWADYQKVCTPRRHYRKGDSCTWNGSLFICVEDTSARPGGPDLSSRSWVLAVKRGADARQRDAR